MCGVAGVVSYRNESEIDTALLYRMCNQIVHRGLDDEGIGSLTFIRVLERDVPPLFIPTLRKPRHSNQTDAYLSGQRTQSKQLERMSRFDLWHLHCFEKLSGTTAFMQPVSTVAGLPAAAVAP